MFCIDSDMFFISPINIEDIMDHYDILYMPQYRGKNDEVKYIWAGLFCIDNKLVEDINFSIGYPEGIQTDTGGMTHYFLKENKLNERYLNSNHIFTYENNILDVNLDGCKQEKFSYIYTDFYEHLFLANKFNFPKPYCFDLFKIAGKVKHFIFHFRSANWANIYNDKEYFQNKKIALFNMMKTLLNE